MRNVMPYVASSTSFTTHLPPKFGITQPQPGTVERLLLTMASTERRNEQEEHDEGNSIDSKKVKSSLLNNTESENRRVSENGDDDDETVIVLDRRNTADSATALWAEQDSPELEERRRSILLRELQRVQRASFVHFLILCLIPTSLLFIVIITVLQDDDLCESTATLCEEEARTFINAFTTRCVCNAIQVTKEDVRGSP